MTMEEAPQPRKEQPTTGWAPVSSLDFDGTKGERPKLVPGIPAVCQPVALATDEWVCAGCTGSIVQADPNGPFEMVHGPGCPVIAAIARQVTGHG